MKAHKGHLVSFAFLIFTACGGEEEKTEYEWRCYERQTSCECHETVKGEDPNVRGTVTEVDDCSGYERCLSYYDMSDEKGRCDCGPAGFEPNVSETQREDTKSVNSCPD
jgi:hypothetical protein